MELAGVVLPPDEAVLGVGVPEARVGFAVRAPQAALGGPRTLSAGKSWRRSGSGQKQGRQFLHRGQTPAAHARRSPGHPAAWRAPAPRPGSRHRRCQPRCHKMPVDSSRTSSPASPSRTRKRSGALAWGRHRASSPKRSLAPDRGWRTGRERRTPAAGRLGAGAGSPASGGKAQTASRRRVQWAERPSSSASRARAEDGRRAGRCAQQLAKKASNRSSRPGRRKLDKRPSCGSRPVRQRNSVTPAEKMSARSSAVAGSASCSGAAYQGEPTTAPRGRPASRSPRSRERPKSMSFSSSDPPGKSSGRWASMRLKGFTSRCRTPSWCRRARAEASCRAGPGSAPLRAPGRAPPRAGLRPAARPGCRSSTP